MRAFSSHVVLFSFFAFAVTGCGGGDGTVEVGMTAQPLQVAAPLPGDTGAEAQARLALTISEVSVHIAGDAEANERGGDGESTGDESADEAGWITVFSGEATVDLLDATSTEELLGSNEVPAGKVTQVRLVLAGAELVDGPITTPVSCPSCSESGLKIVTAGAVEVSPGGTLHLTLDVDQASSLIRDEGGYRLDPVIKIAGAEER
ncbi:DUF4382 domain-containing protein [Sorangium sp. So ce1128]